MHINAGAVATCPAGLGRWRLARRPVPACSAPAAAHGERARAGARARGVCFWPGRQIGQTRVVELARAQLADVPVPHFLIAAEPSCWVGNPGKRFWCRPAAASTSIEAGSRSTRSCRQHTRSANKLQESRLTAKGVPIDGKRSPDHNASIL